MRLDESEDKMKKIAAFLTAFVLFVITVTVIHFSLRGHIGMDRPEFGTWYSHYKDIAGDVVAQEMGEDTLTVFGSSEFRHGRETAWHPANFFKDRDVPLMLIGGSYNQCLNHSLSLGAIEKNMQTRKAVLLISPTWFYKRGVSENHYSLRFSENNYMAFISNRKIRRSVRKYVAKRSEKLLGSDPAMQSNIKIYDKLFISGKDNLFTRLFFNIRRAYVSDKDKIALKVAMNFISKKEKSGVRFAGVRGCSGGIDWEEVINCARKSSRYDADNKYWIRNDVWKRDFKAGEKKAKDRHRKVTFKKSPEYGDLRCFLDVCRDCDIKPMIIVMPLNGRWYDYTGMNKKTRKYLYSRIKAVGKEYGAEVADLSKYEYDKYVMRDAVHPWSEGWAHIDEAIYKFYKK